MEENLRFEALDLVKNQNVSTLSTVEDGKTWARVLVHARVDDDFTVWYSTSSLSNKIRQIRKNNKVCISMYQGKREIRIFGKAELFENPETKREMWKDEMKDYFKGGKDDPDYMVIKVTPEEIEYRDYKKYGTAMMKVTP